MWASYSRDGWFLIEDGKRVKGPFPDKQAAVKAMNEKPKPSKSAKKK